MKITKTNKSRIKSIDFNDLKFGNIFSDHMFICKYQNGRWKDPLIKPYGNIEIFPGTQALHYGQSVFEGLKAFKNKDDDILIFRKEDNYNRLIKSSERLCIPKLPRSIFMDGLDHLIKLDSLWCYNKQGYSLYIRPFIFASSECIKASSSEEYTFMIITSPSKRYYSNDLNLYVEQKYTRASKGGVGYTKAAGNYASSFYPTKLAYQNGFNQIIWTDGENHQYIEEAGTMNIWLRVKDKLITPKLSDTILAGITRDSIMVLARLNNIEVEEKKISLEEITRYYQKGELIEAFGTGTAVSVSPISSITIGDKKIKIEKLEDGFCSILSNQLKSIQYGIVEDNYNWTSKITIE